MILNIKRVFLIVLDSLGAGELPDACDYGDKGAHTLRSISWSPKFHIPNLLKLGIGNIDGLDFLGTNDNPQAAVCKLGELSKGKDSTIGHWEISGIISDSPLPTFPNGFPQEIIDKFSELTGRGILCNKPYSGTQVIADYGQEHERTGDLIVYTSADSVFQIAAHEDVVPIEKLYEYCEIARKMLVGEYGVGRVIARPFVGSMGNYTRTSRRHDFSIVPPSKTILDELKSAGRDVISVGKIKDLFAEQGLTEMIATESNDDGMNKTSQVANRDFNGLCFVNLVDFDTVYGHRNNIDGYAEALSKFDKWLGEFLPNLRDDDILMLTADHGCDPGDLSTDHTREYIPLMIYGKSVLSVNLGIRRTFSDIAATLADIFGVNYTCVGESMFGEVSDMKAHLCSQAKRAFLNSYSPYSGYKVGAALLTNSGKIYTGCNIENAAFSPTICAERTAFAKAVSEGEREFKMIAVAGGKDGIIEGIFPPCGVCRQVMREFCDSDFIILLAKADGYEEFTLSQLLPSSFSI